MRRGKLRGILILLLLLLFLSGLSILLFPHLWGAFVDLSMKMTRDSHALAR